MFAITDSELLCDSALVSLLNIMLTLSITLINALSFYKLTQVRTLLNGETTKRSKLNQMLVSDEIKKKSKVPSGKSLEAE